MEGNNSVIKRLRTGTLFDYINPTTKIIAFLLFIFIVFLAANISQLLVVLAIAILFLLVIRVKLRYLFKPLIFMLIFFPFTLVFNMFVIEGQEGHMYWFSIGNQEIYKESFIISGEIFLKVYLLILISSVLILSMNETELTNGFEKLISPLKKIKVPTQEIALIISIALRYIPLFLYETKLILEAEGSRGVDFYSGNTSTKVIALKNSLNPLIVNSFSKAKELSMAMSARGYKVNMNRTKYVIYKFKLKEFFLLSFFIAFLIVVIFLRVIELQYLN